MSDETVDKVRENRLRRMAQRQGLWLRKSRRRDHRALDYGDWYVVEPNRNVLIRTCPTLDCVEACLTA